jgi:hypothetical protein
MLISFLIGHSLQGLSAKYTNELMIANSEALRAAKEMISRWIFELLGLTLEPPTRCPLAHAPTEKSKAAAPARVA